jgi:hypothetical protein
MKESNTENRTKEKREEAEKGGALAERPPFSLAAFLLLKWSKSRSQTLLLVHSHRESA